MLQRETVPESRQMEMKKDEKMRAHFSNYLLLIFFCSSSLQIIYLSWNECRNAHNWLT